MTQEEIRRFTEAGSLQTPCYIFDEDELTGRVQQIKEALASCSAELCFAVKANPFLIPLLDPVVGKYEVCSPGDLQQHFHRSPERSAHNPSLPAVLSLSGFPVLPGQESDGCYTLY